MIIKGYLTKYIGVIFFWLDHFFEARAELRKFSLVFGEIEVKKNILLRFPELYYIVKL